MTIKKQIEEKWKALKAFIWEHRRFWVILGIAPLQVLLFFCFRGLWESIFHFGTKVRLATLIPILIAAPYALFIWYWRDMAKRADIETARADLLQKEFHQIEQWATESDNKVLRLAVIHQLHPYATATGAVKKVTVFQKPASEIYKALLINWAKEVENDLKKLSENKAEAGAEKSPMEFFMALDRPSYIDAIHKIVKKDWGKLPDDFLHEIHLGFSYLHEANFSGADLSSTSFHNASLCGADLSRAKGLDTAMLGRAIYSKGGGKRDTQFPDGFDPDKHGMVRFEGDE